MEWLVEVLRVAVSSAVVVSFVYWLARKRIETSLAERLQAHQKKLDRELQAHQKELDRELHRELEEFKADLRLEAERELQRQRAEDERRRVEHETGFRWLQAKRADVLEEIYRLSCAAAAAVANAEGGVFFAAHPPQEEIEAARTAAEALTAALMAARIVLPNHLLQLVDDLVKLVEDCRVRLRREAQSLASDLDGYRLVPSDELQEATKRLGPAIVAVAEAIRAEFTRPLGTVPDTEAPEAT